MDALDFPRSQRTPRTDAPSQTESIKRKLCSLLPTDEPANVARTIADLAGSERIQTAHVAEAVQYRRGLAAR